MSSACFFYWVPGTLCGSPAFSCRIGYPGGPNPLPKQDDCRKNAAVKLARRATTSADKAHLLAAAERWLHFADELDYLIRRWVVPVPYGDGRSVAATPLFRWSLPRKHSRGVSRSTQHRTASMRSNGLLSEVQAAIGQGLSAEYDLAQSIPNRLVDLLRQLEQRNGESGCKGIAGDGYPRRP